jgi:hypothetical protein
LSAPSGGRREGAQSFHGVGALRHDPDDRDRFGEPLEGDAAALLVPNAVDRPREVRDLSRSKDLAGSRLTAEPSSQVQRATAVTALDRDCLSGIEPDAHRERERGRLERLLDEPLLELDGRADRLPGRGEHAQGLVPSKLEQGAVATLDPFTCDVGELGRELGSGLVASLLGEQGVAADVGDQERPDVDVLGALGPA